MHSLSSKTISESYKTLYFLEKTFDPELQPLQKLTESIHIFKKNSLSCLNTSRYLKEKHKY